MINIREINSINKIKNTYQMERSRLLAKIQEIQELNYNTYKGTNEAQLQTSEDLADLFIHEIAQATGKQCLCPMCNPPVQKLPRPKYLDYIVNYTPPKYEHKTTTGGLKK